MLCLDIPPKAFSGAMGLFCPLEREVVLVPDNVLFNDVEAFDLVSFDLKDNLGKGLVEFDEFFDENSESKAIFEQKLDLCCVYSL